MNRFDKELHERGLAKSRSSAADLIARGAATVNGVICTKSARLVSERDVIACETPRYVSRGGLKLERALREFGTDLRGLTCLDTGASTGGFTDCMLQHGAARVYAVDVGSNQLDPLLREDSRVVSMERCDIRGAVLPEKIDFAAVDVSFISAKLILPELNRLSKSKASAIVLLKPQFETGRRHKGVVTDRRVHEKIVADFIREYSAYSARVIESPVLGGDGNREFLMELRFT
jgi:23S rRNA (cytidine1920-2'-O)/16S rRNA (cytidine1409-2'-O)-methyltransferase